MQARKDKAKKHIESTIVKPVRGIVNPIIIPSDLPTTLVVKGALAEMYCNTNTRGTYLNGAENILSAGDPVKLLNSARVVYTGLVLTEVTLRHGIAKITNTNSAYLDNPNKEPGLAFKGLSLFAAPVTALRAGVGLVAASDTVVFNLKS